MNFFDLEERSRLEPVRTMNLEWVGPDDVSQLPDDQLYEFTLAILAARQSAEFGIASVSGHLRGADWEKASELVLDLKRNLLDYEGLSVPFGQGSNVYVVLKPGRMPDSFYHNVTLT